MSEYITTIVAYEPKEIRPADGSPYTLHKFRDINNTELVARADVANLVRGYMNQPLRVTVRSEVKGRFTNHYLDHAAPAQNGAAAAQQAQQAHQAQAYQQTPIPSPQPPVPPPTPPPPVPQGMLPHQIDRSKDEAIHRQVAAKVAAAISTTSHEFWRNVLDLAYYFDTGQVPQNPAPGPQAGYQTGAPPLGDEDIPF